MLLMNRKLLESEVTVGHVSKLKKIHYSSLPIMDVVVTSFYHFALAVGNTFNAAKSLSKNL